MATNKERMEALEDGVGRLTDHMERMEAVMTEKLQLVEATLSKLSNKISGNSKESSSSTHFKVFRREP